MSSTINTIALASPREQCLQQEQDQQNYPGEGGPQEHGSPMGGQEQGGCAGAVEDTCVWPHRRLREPYIQGYIGISGPSTGEMMTRHQVLFSLLVSAADFSLTFYRMALYHQ